MTQDHHTLHRQSPVRGILWMVAASAFFSIAFGVVRYLADEIHAFEQTFFRQLIGMFIMLPFVVRQGWSSLRTSQWKTNIVRNIAGFSGICCSFWSVTLIPMADALALQFTLPLFTILFAFVILAERPGPHRWVAMVIGFLGAMMILRPGFAEISLGMLVALGAAASFGISDTLLRKLSRTDGTTAIVFYGFAMHLPLALPLALTHWTTPSAAHWPWLLAMGLTSFGAQFSLSKAFIHAEASVVSPVLFLRLPMVAAIGYVFFAQVSDVFVWIGAVVIFSGTLYAARREALAMNSGKHHD